MPLISHKTIVRRWTNRVTFEGYQKLCRVTLIWGVPVWTRVLDTEDVPSWASIQVACLGYTDWRSKFAREYRGEEATHEPD